MVEMSRVVARLVELSGKGQAPWKRTADPTAFAATFGQLSVLISLRRPTGYFPVRDTYKLAALDEEGNELDSVSYTQGPFQIDSLDLESLYNTAKRTVLGVDQKLEELIEAMDQIDRT